MLHSPACLDLAASTAAPLGRPRYIHPYRPVVQRPSSQQPFGKLGCRATTEETESTSEQESPEAGNTSSNERKPKARRAETPDFISSELTRRFGIAGGLAWAGVLAFGVISEQIKTRIEESSEARNTVDVADQKEIVTPSGLRIVDVRKGGGASPRKSYLLILHFKASVDGRVVEDTYARDKPIVAISGGRPFTGGLCQGVEEALSTMQAGGIRKVKVPSALAFGERGYSFQPTRHVDDKGGIIPPNSTVDYELELIRVSIPP